MSKLTLIVIVVFVVVILMTSKCQTNSDVADLNKSRGEKRNADGSHVSQDTQERKKRATFGEYNPMSRNNGPKVQQRIQTRSRLVRWRPVTNASSCNAVVAELHERNPHRYQHRVCNCTVTATSLDLTCEYGPYLSPEPFQWVFQNPRGPALVLHMTFFCSNDQSPFTTREGCSCGLFMFLRQYLPTIRFACPPGSGTPERYNVRLSEISRSECPGCPQF